MFIAKHSLAHDDLRDLQAQADHLVALDEVPFVLSVRCFDEGVVLHVASLEDVYQWAPGSTLTGGPAWG